ncbi:NUDIX domain-containing protein [Sulfitobacter sp. BDSS02]|nr:NUDIX domain-containing protein [Sulfitobacter sp. BDSS02]MBR9852577.1 NUDIX domain-containing protein [Paracoccaceae bacterium]
MSDLFFYGTLCNLPLLERVLGHAVETAPAVLEDHAAFWAAGEAFPIIAERPGARAEGLLARGLSDEDVARLRFYEGAFDYDLEPVQLVGGDQALVFFSATDRWEPGAPWLLPDWEEKWAELQKIAAVEIMAWYGRISAEEMVKRFTPISIRANARMVARRRPASTDWDLTKDVEVHAHHRPYMNFFTMEEMDLQFRRHDGSMSDVLNRGALMVGEAAVVLPYDPLRDRVLLVQQFRAPVFMLGDPDPWIWEPVAGLVDPGETAEEAARREAQEEAGLTVRQLHAAGKCYSSTGSSGEFLNLFIGICDLEDRPEGGGGLESEGEDLVSRLVSYDELIADIDAERHRDMPLVTTSLWLSRHRDRLRAEAGI